MTNPEKPKVEFKDSRGELFALGETVNLPCEVIQVIEAGEQCLLELKTQFAPTNGGRLTVFAYSHQVIGTKPAAEKPTE